MTAGVLTALGGTLFLLGLLHRSRWGADVDRKIFLALHAMLAPRRRQRLFRLLWVFGTSPLTLLALVLWLGWGPQPRWAPSLIYALAAGLERGVKLLLRRPRPFQALADVRMGQPRRPHDPSFPSGDALRAAFLTTLAWAAWGPTAGVLALILALLVSLGRIALGVHYPLDALAGFGLGLLAGGGVWWFLAH